MIDTIRSDPIQLPRCLLSAETAHHSAGGEDPGLGAGQPGGCGAAIGDAADGETSEHQIDANGSEPPPEAERWLGAPAALLLGTGVVWCLPAELAPF